VPNPVPVGVNQLLHQPQQQGHYGLPNGMYDMMVITRDDSGEDGASCCGTVPSLKQGAGGQGPGHFRTHSLEQLTTYNFLSNDHEDEVLVLFTSGTTGNKKLVPHNLGDVMIASAVIAVSWNLSPADINCNLMPLFHVGGIIRQVFAPILSGGSVICCPSFDVHLFWQLLLGEHPAVNVTLPDTFTWYYAAPTMHQVILGNLPGSENTDDVAAAMGDIADNQSTLATTTTPSSLFIKTCNGGRRHLRMIANAAGGLLPSLAQELRATFGANVLPSYGMTECMPISSPPYNYELTKPGTSGVAVGPEIAIFDNHFQPLPVGREGNICVRGRPCFRGYGTTADMYHPEHIPKAPKSFLEGAWFNTGDLGYLDEDGYLYITGRSKEVINRGGEIISPLEVEEEVVQHPSIKSCAAFSAAHNVLQECVGIVLVHKQGCRRLDLPSLHTFLQNRLAPSKWPQCLVYMDALPKSHTNKLLRVKLGQRLNLPELNDGMFPVERTFEATCPPQGTLVGVSIPSEAVTVDLEYIQDVLRQELQIPPYDGNSVTTEMMNQYTRYSFPPQQTQASEDFMNVKGQPLPAVSPPPVHPVAPSPISQILVTAHPSRVGSVTVHCYNVDPKAIIHTSHRVFDAYLRPSHICSYTTEITMSNLKTYPEPTDAVVSILNDNGEKKAITDPMVREIQELVQKLIDLDCLPAPDSSFFHVGGSSLLASQLASRIRKAYNVEFSGTDVFRHNTCVHMAQKVQQQRPEFKSLANSSMESSSHTSSLHSGREEDAMETNKKSSSSRDRKNNNNGSNKACSVDLQGIPLDVKRLKAQAGVLGNIFQLVPLFGFFPLFQFSRFFLFFMSLLVILHRMPGPQNIFKFIFTLVAFHFLWTLLTPLIFVLIKWTVIGRYKQGRYPLWGQYYMRWWFVDICRKVIGRGVWGSHNGLLCTYYRMLGAKIGANVRMSLEAEIAEFDLLDFGDGACIEYSTARGFGVDNGAMILGPIRIGQSASVGVKSVVAPYAQVPDFCHVGPGTSSYEITREDDRHLHYNRYALPKPAWWMENLVGSPIMFLVDTISHIPAMAVLYFLVIMHSNTHNKGFHTVGDMMEWLCEPKRIPYYIAIRVARAVVAPWFYMTAAILVKWIVIGKFKPGPRDVTSQWTLLRHWLASKLFSRENMQEMTDLLGRHYESVSIFYRLLGAKIGKRVFWPGHQFVFSGEFDLLEIGDDVVFGSRSVVFCTTVDSCHKVIFCAGSNISDNTIVLPGGIVGKNAVLASNTVCPAGRYLPEGSIYLGSRGGEPMVLEPGSEGIANDVILSADIKENELQLQGDETTLRPFGRAVYHREADYFVWPAPMMMLFTLTTKVLFETVHALPLLGALHFTGGILYGFPVSERDYDAYDYPTRVVYGTMVACYLGTHAIRVIICLVIEIASKWMLMGRRSEGRYNWDTSSYGQNWEFYQVLSHVRKLHRCTILDFIAGSKWINYYFQALGAKVGKDCCLYPAGADPFMPEPDLVEFGDRVVIDMASVVSHLNTRGNFELVKIKMEDHVTLRARSRIQQGVHMEAGSMLLEKSLALTGEVIDRDSVWQGAPAACRYRYEFSMGMSPSTSFDGCGYTEDDSGLDAYHTII
jgi:acyl-CoA synthetase (AMP-forming)/AMP-acid ligase II/carbonic anhydrase/acetyltransferase-like protein (isoleucine patch superfamily)